MLKGVGQLCLTCRPLRPSRWFCAAQFRSSLYCYMKVSYILIACPYVDNLEFDIFDADGPQCHFIMSSTIAVRIRMLSVY